MSSIKRETSITVGDLHNVSDSIKRLAISIDGYPVKIATSQPRGTDEIKASNIPQVELSTSITSNMIDNKAAESKISAFTLQRPPSNIYSILSNAKTNFADKYEMRQEIGKGGFSTVHQCRDRDTEEIYAVKVLFHLG